MAGALHNSIVLQGRQILRNRVDAPLSGPLRPGFMRSPASGRLEAPITDRASLSVVHLLGAEFAVLPANLLAVGRVGLSRSGPWVTGCDQACTSRRQSLWVSEMNSVSCGRTPGVEHSFATALWAPDVLFELVRAGVDGVNWHVRPLTFNAPFRLRARAIEPMPELYGLAVFAHMLGPDARLDAVHVSSASVVHLKAWAVRSRGATSVLLINKGGFAARVTLRAGKGRGAARIQRLLAPSVGSNSRRDFRGSLDRGRWTLARARGQPSGLDRARASMRSDAGLQRGRRAGRPAMTTAANQESVAGELGSERHPASDDEREKVEVNSNAVQG